MCRTANFQYGGPHMGDNRLKTRSAHAQKSICLKSLAHLIFGRDSRYFGNINFQGSSGLVPI